MQDPVVQQARRSVAHWARIQYGAIVAGMLTTLVGFCFSAGAFIASFWGLDEGFGVWARYVFPLPFLLLGIAILCGDRVAVWRSRC